MILDTHVAIWVDQGEKISAEASREIARASEAGTLMISAISAWEIAMLLRAGRMQASTTSEHFIDNLFQLPGVTEAPVTYDIARVAGELPESLHGDPADRIIIATASVFGVPLVTRDRQILNFAESHSGFACIAA